MNLGGPHDQAQIQAEGGEPLNRPKDPEAQIPRASCPASSKSAERAATKHDRVIAMLRGTGMLKEFTRIYRRHRLAAAESGRGFMSYANAVARLLRQGQIPLLMNGGKPVVGTSLFAEVFGGA